MWRQRRRAPPPQVLSLLALLGTKVQILTPEALQRYSVYLLYYDKSTNTGATEALQRLRPSRKRGSDKWLNSLALLVPNTDAATAESEALKKARERQMALDTARAGAQLACFTTTSTKAQIPTQQRARSGGIGSCCACRGREREREEARYGSAAAPGAARGKETCGGAARVEGCSCRGAGCCCCSCCCSLPEVMSMCIHTDIRRHALY
jgi:hypothetical protein